MSASNLRQNAPPTSNGVSVRIRDIDPNNKEDVKTITRLHLKLLDWGPMARLGKLFMERFCYTVLLKDNLMKAAISEVDGKPAGFIAYTDKSITFHRFAIRKHLVYVIYLVILSIIRYPWVIFRLPKAIYLMLSRREEKNLGEDPQAEVLAIGVLQEYRNPIFIRRTGLRISKELLDRAASYFKSIGIKKMRLIVDADNTPALIFYHSLGSRFEPYELAGAPSILIWFEV
jgi:ribosomal protein S18 acetylase RimI-like enzyme